MDEKTYNEFTKGGRAKELGERLKAEGLSIPLEEWQRNGIIHMVAVFQQFVEDVLENEQDRIIAVGAYQVALSMFWGLDGANDIWELAHMANAHVKTMAAQATEATH